MAFGYNDIVWILSVIALTITVTTIILYILKREKTTLRTGFFRKKRKV